MFGVFEVRYFGVRSKTNILYMKIHIYTPNSIKFLDQIWSSVNFQTSASFFNFFDTVPQPTLLVSIGEKSELI